MSVTNRLRNQIESKIDDIIKGCAWIDREGRGSIQQENFENLQIALSDYIFPLLEKAGWFVDEDDELLTCIPNQPKECAPNQSKGNEVYFEKRPPEEVQEYLQIGSKIAEFQLRDRYNNEKMQIAISALRLFETSDRLTLMAIREIALKALDDIASTDNQEEVPTI